MLLVPALKLLLVLSWKFFLELLEEGLRCPGSIKMLGSYNTEVLVVCLGLWYHVFIGALQLDRNDVRDVCV
jgi:hypothetical protein